MKNKINKTEANINKIAQDLFIIFKENDIKIAGQKNIDLIDFINLCIEIEPITTREDYKAFERAIVMYYTDKIEKVRKLRIKSEYKTLILEGLNFNLESDIDSIYILNTSALNNKAA